MSEASPARIGRVLEALYSKYHHPEYIHPDPLELVLPFDDPRDREVAALIAASLSLGRVSSILRSVSSILGTLGSPRDALVCLQPFDLRRLFAGFVYRFYTAEDLVNLLIGIRESLRRYGTLEDSFRSCMDPGDDTLHKPLERFVRLLAVCAGAPIPMLPRPERGSACKRLHLFLRWMVRKDAVDPGGWPDIPSSKLLVPLDVHQLAVCRLLGITKRRSGNIRTAMEITAFLRLIDPRDPVRFDFSMTRLGIRPELRYDEVFGLEADV